MPIFCCFLLDVWPDFQTVPVTVNIMWRWKRSLHFHNCSLNVCLRQSLVFCLVDCTLPGIKKEAWAGNALLFPSSHTFAVPCRHLFLTTTNVGFLGGQQNSYYPEALRLPCPLYPKAFLSPRANAAKYLVSVIIFVTGAKNSQVLRSLRIL